MAHECMATECSIQVADNMLMCGKHWRMVPREVQNRVYDTYRRGLKIFQDAERFSAVKDAVTAVETREGKVSVYRKV